MSGPVVMLVVVMLAPHGSYDSRFSQRIEDFAVQQFVAQSCVEAFDIAVLPWTAGLDVQRFDTDLAQPLAQSLGNELRSVV